MFSRIIISLLSLIAIGILYVCWSIDEKYAPYLIPVGLLIAAAIVFTPQIDWWWAKRYPPKTDKRVIQFMEKFSPYYLSLTPPLQKFFLHRMELIIKSLDWMPMGFEDIPADAQYALASYIAQLSQNREKFLFKYWEKIVLYKHPFPSPQFPKELHHSEIFYEDHVVLMDFPQMIKGFINPYEVFPIGLYEMIRVYLHDFKLNLDFKPDSFSEELFTAISGKDFSWVKSSTGLDLIDGEAVAVVCFFLFPEKTKALAGEWYEECRSVFG